MSTSLFRRMQMQNKENKDTWIYRRCIGIRISSDFE